MRKTAVFLILVTFCICLSGCYDAKEVDDLAYVIALGLDKGKTNSLRITFQIAVPKNLGSGGSDSQQSSGQGGGNNSYDLITIEAPAINPSFDMLNAFISRDLILSHTKAVVISEELAKEGILPYVREMIRNREFRRKLNFLVSRTSAEEYLKSVKPKLEINPAKYYDLNDASGNYTGTIPSSTLLKMYERMLCTGRQPAAILASVNRYGTDKPFDTKQSTFKNKNRDIPFEGDFFAGDIPKNSELGAEIMGTAVFDGSRLVGELDGETTYYYLLGSSEYIRAVWTFKDPLHKNEEVAITISKNRKTNVKVKIVNQIPIINVSLNLEGDILAIHSGQDYENPQRIKILESYITEYIKNRFTQTFNILAKKYKSDIFGFGRNARLLFTTLKDWEEFNWKRKFSDARLNLKINFHIRRAGLILKSDPPVSSQGKE
ncbi:MAG: Ger(x)C family spore germination protein [Deltaproteobacteria bacterium]